MNKTVDFKWLEEKTSPEMVAAVKKVVEGGEVRKNPILYVQQRESIVEECKIHSIGLYITTDLECHYFNYDVKRNSMIHDKMFRFAVQDFAKMEKERIEQLNKKVKSH